MEQQFFSSHERQGFASARTPECLLPAQPDVGTKGRDGPFRVRVPRSPPRKEVVPEAAIRSDATSATKAGQRENLRCIIRLQMPPLVLDQATVFRRLRLVAVGRRATFRLDYCCILEHSIKSAPSICHLLSPSLSQLRSGRQDGVSSRASQTESLVAENVMIGDGEPGGQLVIRARDGTERHFDFADTAPNLFLRWIDDQQLEVWSERQKLDFGKNPRLGDVRNRSEII